MVCALVFTSVYELWGLVFPPFVAPVTVARWPFRDCLSLKTRMVRHSKPRTASARAVVALPLQPRLRLSFPVTMRQTETRSRSTFRFLFRCGSDIRTVYWTATGARFLILPMSATWMPLSAATTKTRSSSRRNYNKQPQDTEKQQQPQYHRVIHGETQQADSEKKRPALSRLCASQRLLGRCSVSKRGLSLVVRERVRVEHQSHIDRSIIKWRQTTKQRVPAQLTQTQPKTQTRASSRSDQTTPVRTATTATATATTRCVYPRSWTATRLLRASLRILLAQSVV